MNVTRREVLSALALAAHPVSAADNDFDADLVKRHDTAIDYYFANQVTQRGSRWHGALPDAYGLHAPGTAFGMMEVLTAGWLCPQSRHHKSGDVLERMKMAAAFAGRSMSSEGNIYLPITNFNSPPDSAFAARGAAQTALMARRAKAKEISDIIEPLLKRMADAISVGGIHTPNHRWVVCAALAQAHEIFPEPAYLKRIDQWLAEGIDLDPDGQWSERSTGGYNAICNSAFVAMADKLKRPELLEPVRRNLEAMLYLMHPNGEVVTEFSRRQDANTRGTMAGYWFSAQYLAVKDKNPRMGTLAKQLWPVAASLSTLMAWPELNKRDMATDPLPDNYEHTLTHNKLFRVRRGQTSMTLSTEGRDRFFMLRRGELVINAVRFATAFFGKAQFIPTKGDRIGKGWTLTQDLDGPYFQPFDPVRKIDADSWDETQPLRPRTQIARLTQSAVVSELPNGFRVRVQASGTDNVPLAIEINLREGTQFDGAEPVKDLKDAWLMTQPTLVCRAGTDSIVITGGGCEHKYTQVRGAQPKLDGPSLYVTGYTPFDRTIDFLVG